MPEATRPQLPIGHWLKQADEALTARIEAAQAPSGLSRTEWQVLNVLEQTGGATDAQLAEPLRPFADAAALADVLLGLSRRSLVQADGPSGWHLTDGGRQLHADALARQKQVRQQAMAGISETDYATTVAVLQRLVANLTGKNP